MTHPTEHDREQEIFAGAIDLPTDQRAAYLETACQGDPQLRTQIEALLTAYDQAGSDGFLDSPTGGLAQAQHNDHATHPEEQIGAMIGPYQILQRLGEGGFGTVYEAQQETPIKRRVALKVIKLGMDTKQVIARFEAERQALAMMDHPGIARVFDAGATESGRPYFVMELVDGEPITRYCDRHQLSVRDRLELFQQVCRAVQHAHLKGVIHRDLKPSNILVTQQDHRPVPKVIDFGIAKATEQSVDDHTAVTQLRQMLGTPAYMSPEQAAMSRTDIDTRSDVYSLGIILYELLTGTTPFDSITSASKDPSEFQRLIQDQTPSKPSTKLSRTQTLSNLAKQRRCEPRKLGALIKGDLDWITLKAIEKDRTRRYETPSALAADIARYLNDESVEASPPSVAYTALKFARRNRLAISFVLAIIAVLCIGIVSTGVFAMRSVRAERIAAAEARTAQIELTRATEIKALLSEMLNSIDPNIAQGRDTTILRDILTRAAARIQDGQITDELVKAEIATTLANVYVAIGDGASALPFAQMAYDTRSAALGEDAQDTIETRSILAEANDALGNLSEAQRLYESNIEIMNRVWGPEDRRTLVAGLLLVNFQSLNADTTQPAEDIRAFYELNKRVLGDSDTNTMGAQHALANHLARIGQIPESTEILSEVVATMRQHLGDDDPNTILAMSGLGVNLLTLNRIQEAEPLIREGLERGRRVMGDRHPSVLSSMNNLAYLMLRQGNPDEAVTLTREVITIQSELLGEDHPSVIQTAVNLGGLLASLGRFDEATEVLTAALANARRVLGDTNPHTLRLLNNLGGILIEQDRLDEALPILRDALTLKQEIQGDNHPDTLRTTVNLATVYERTDHRQEAADLYRTVYHARAATLEPANPDRIRSSIYLAGVLLEMNAFEEVLSMLRTELPGARAAWESSEPGRFADFLTFLGRAEQAQTDLNQAREHFTQALALVAPEPSEPDEAAAEPAQCLLEVLLKLHQQDPEAGYDHQAEQLRDRFSAVLQ